MAFRSFFVVVVASSAFRSDGAFSLFRSRWGKPAATTDRTIGTLTDTATNTNEIGLRPIETSILLRCTAHTHTRVRIYGHNTHTYSSLAAQAQLHTSRDNTTTTMATVKYIVYYIDCTALEMPGYFIPAFLIR